MRRRWWRRPTLRLNLSRLRKDLIEAMDQATKAKEKVKELSEALKLEKILIAQKDDEIQATLLKTNEGHEKVIA